MCANNFNYFQEYRAVNKEIRQFYFGNHVIDRSKTVQYVKLLSDLNACYGIDKAVKWNASKSKGKTYYARLVFRKQLRCFDGFSKRKKL